MGSIEEAPPAAANYGTFEIPVFLPEDEAVEDLWKRPYGKPPKFDHTVKRIYPLVNYREEVFGDEPSFERSAEFMDKYGFTAVKHRSAAFEAPHSAEDFDDLEFMDEVYFPETIELVKQVTGCKHVFCQRSFLRGPPPTKKEKPSKNTAREAARNTALAGDVDMEKPIHTTERGPVIRMPHVDATELLGRRQVRFQSRNMAQVATEAGIIDAEDKICAKHGLAATDKESEEVVAAEYNVDGKLGPRYASFSIWRPMKKVLRDPLAMAPKHQFKDGVDEPCAPWPYLNSQPGFKGDWASQLEMLRVKRGEVEPPAEIEGPHDGVESRPKWYYLPNQDVDEVLFVKLFDSAALGDGGTVAQAPLHASPNIHDGTEAYQFSFGGVPAYSSPRESVEVRLVVIW